MFPRWLRQYFETETPHHTHPHYTTPTPDPPSPPGPIARLPLVTYLQGLEAGDPVTFESLSILPLYQRSHSHFSYLLLEEALHTQQFSLHEISERGSVPYLKAINQLHLPVLVLDGEELVGARQNRIANASFLLPPQTQLPLPVSCIERGRWAYLGKRFKTGDTIFSAGARRRKMRSVSHSLSTTNDFGSDQRQIWGDIQKYIHKSNTLTGTQNYSDYVQHRKNDIAAYEEALPYQDDQVGQIVFLKAQFLALDCLDQPQKARQLYPKLLRSYIHEALDPLESLPPHPKLHSNIGGQGILEYLWQLMADVYPSVGIGTDLRFQDKLLMGSALLHEHHPLHIEVFPVISPQ